MPRTGVVGHVEAVEFAVVDALPAPGEIVHAREHFRAPAGGGAVAAVAMARMTGAARFLTAVGDDATGAAMAGELRAVEGLELHAAVRSGAPQRRGFTHLGADDHERTITVLGERLIPLRADPLPWDGLGELDGIYFTGGDAGALHAARAAAVLVATSRAMDTIVAAGVPLDVLVASATDPGERIPEGVPDPPPRHVVLTRGAAGGTWTAADGAAGTWAAQPLPGAPVDAFGCGDTFAAGLTVALASGAALDEALAFAARAGAAVLTGRGPYGAELPVLG